MMEKLKQKELHSSYYDFYKELLTEKQREYFELYILFDNSITEISEELSVSRSAVHDNVTRTIKLLSKYEEKLGLHHKSVIREVLLCELETDENREIIEKIRELE